MVVYERQQHHTLPHEALAVHAHCGNTVEPNPFRAHHAQCLLLQSARSGSKALAVQAYREILTKQKAQAMCVTFHCGVKRMWITSCSMFASTKYKV
eukprot:924849-Pelagomonas_calceolata.AAC.3